jgi:hypothetical protein
MRRMDQWIARGQAPSPRGEIRFGLWNDSAALAVALSECF